MLLLSRRRVEPRIFYSTKALPLEVLRMLQREVDGIRLARRLLVLVIVLIVVSFSIFSFLGIALSASSVVDLEKTLIQVDGILIAFTGIIFTGMLAEIRARTERALLRPETSPLADRLARRARALRVSALGSLILLISSLASSLGDLSAALAFPAVPTLLAVALVIPFGLMAGGLALILVALALVALD